MKHLLDDAERVAKGACVPEFAKREYEEAMLDLAKREAHALESVASAFARLCAEGDERMNALYSASYQAGVRRSIRDEEEFSKMRREHGRIWNLMVKTARHERRESETVEQALSRLLETDETMREAYDLYCETVG